MALSIGIVVLYNENGGLATVFDRLAERFMPMRITLNYLTTSTQEIILSFFKHKNSQSACPEDGLIQFLVCAQQQNGIGPSLLVQLLVGAILLVLLVIAVALLISRIRMNAKLSSLVNHLEERVQERTRALETSAEISRRLTMILDLDELLPHVVAGIQHAFGYYQVHIYLVDENSGELVYREGTGDAGRQLKEKRYKLQPGKGIVGTAADNGKPVLADNVADVPGFIDNPLLPGIRSELAVPVRHSDSVMGVLDLQSEEVSDFDENDLVLMQSIADQVAVAIQNAQLYRQLEKQTLEAENARETSEQASRAKSEFMANMSHEFRTPLNGILGYAQILKRDSHLTDAQRDGLNAINESGIHLLNLINDVLDLSKIEVQKMDLYEIDFNFSNFLQGIVGIAQVQAEEHGLAFSFKKLTPLPHGVRADDKRLRQVLINLLGNAGKFTDQGKVVLRVGVVGEANKEMFRVRFEVEDTGIGLPADQLEKIFLPFEQVGEKNSDTEGTGLGLAISKQLVEMMGGKLHVKSGVGQGSTFWFEIDLKQAEGEVQEDHIDLRLIEDYKGKRVKVLVVDDKPHNRTFLVTLLKPLGFTVFEAANGREAVMQAQDIHPDAILMDLVMPVKNGFEATQEIRQDLAMDDVVIIALSASVFNEHRRRSMTAGCDLFIPKPIDTEELLKQIQTRLGLEWIYRNEDDTGGDWDEELVQQPMVAPPLEEIQVLFDLAMKGDMVGLECRTHHLERMGENYRSFADKLRRLAKDFEDEQILTMIEAYMEAD